MSCSLRFLGSLAATEKSHILKDKNGQLVFFTAPCVTKGQFKAAFKSRFKNLKLLGISSSIIKGKARRFRGKIGSRSDRKKMVVLVDSGKSLELESL
jgi:large subunit ribosomal protein L23